MHIVDLTGLVEERMWVDNPLIGPPVIEQIASVEGPTGWSAHRVTLYTLTGTYIEASAHVVSGGETIDRVAPERFVRRASIIRLPTCDARHAITPAELAMANVSPRPGDAVLVATGWDRMWNQPGYVEESPYFTTEAMLWLLALGPSIVGGDFPSFDSGAESPGVVSRLLEAGCLLLAPLVNLHKARAQRPFLVALPLNVKGVCGMPCRAILIEDIETECE